MAGRITGRAIGGAISLAEIIGGGGLFLGGTGATAGSFGITSPVSAPVATGGALLAAHGMNGLYNLTQLDPVSFNFDGLNAGRNPSGEPINAGNQSSPSLSNNPFNPKHVNERRATAQDYYGSLERKTGPKQSSSAAKTKGTGEHKKNKRPSTENTHQEGQARKQRDQGGEKGDARREKRK